MPSVSPRDPTSAPPHELFLTRWTVRLLRLYPEAWRDRYGDEVAAVLDRHPVTLWTTLDLLIGAFDAHLHCDLLPERLTSMSHRLRNAEFAVFCAYIAFVVAGMGFAKIVEYDDFHAATSAYPLIGAAFAALVVGALAALAAVIIGGLPLAVVAAQRAFTSRHWGILALLCVPVLAFVVFVGYAKLIVSIVGPDVSGGSGLAPRTYYLGISLAMVFVLCAVVSTVAVTLAIRRSEISPSLYRFARVPTALASLAMLVVTASLLVWGLSLRANVPTLFTGNDGLLSTNTAANWLVIVGIMALATILALWATIQGFVVRRTGSSSVAIG